MSTGKWLAVVAVVATASFFGGAEFHRSAVRSHIEWLEKNADEYERGYKSLEERDKEWHNAFHKGFTPNPPPRYIPFAGVSR